MSTFPDLVTFGELRISFLSFFAPEINLIIVPFHESELLYFLNDNDVSERGPISLMNISFFLNFNTVNCFHSLKCSSRRRSSQFSTKTGV